MRGLTDCCDNIVKYHKKQIFNGMNTVTHLKITAYCSGCGKFQKRGDDECEVVSIATTSDIDWETVEQPIGMEAFDLFKNINNKII